MLLPSLQFRLCLTAALATAFVVIDFEKFFGMAPWRLCRIRLFQSQQSQNVALVHFGYEAAVGEVAFLFLGLLGEDVALESVFSLDLS